LAAAGKGTTLRLDSSEDVEARLAYMEPSQDRETSMSGGGEAVAVTGICTREASDGRSTVRRALPLLIVVVAAAAGYLLLRDFDAFGALAEHREAIVAWCEAHRVSAVGIYVATFVGVVVLSLPGAFAMTVTGGFLFGLLPGALLSVVSATLGGLVVFLVARFGLGEPARAWLMARGSGAAFRRIERGLQENAIVYMLLLRLVPAVPFTVANVAPAFFGIKARTFALTTFFGIMPGTTITAWIGVGLNEIFDRGDRPDIGILADPHVYGPILGLIALATLPLVVKRLRRGSVA
jgi:uncharacterized membrane protein YdjX (TVP38/TMEM64 family)